MKRKLMLLMTCLFIGIGLVNAQISKVTGTVISEEDGLPVVGASIVVKGTTLGTVTDMDGKFTLTNVPSSAETLMVSFIGMKTQEVAIKPTVNVLLKSDTEMLDEVMVVAYGTAKKSAFTGSASVVKSDKIENRLVSDVTNALSGTVSGVQTTSANGQPGTSATVRIRGIGSMYASNSPLYVLDGVPYDGDISSVNPSDIETMTVLKDAAAAALYGSRGANGVILITTKKGKSGEAKVTVDARWGANSRQISNYNVIKDPALYMELVYASQYNSGYINQAMSPAEAHAYANSRFNTVLGYQVYDTHGQDLIGVNGKLNPNATMGYSDGDYYYTADDWEKETYRSGLRQEYNASIQGGGDKINYFFSAAYLNDEGVIENSAFDRISVRSNVDYQAKKWLKIGSNMSYTSVTSKYPGEQTASASSGNAFNLANSIAPIYPFYVREASGAIKYDANTGHPVMDYGDGKSTNNTRSYMSISNPVSDLLYNTEEYLMDIFTGNWYARLTPIDGLTITGTAGLTIDNTRYHYVGNRYYGQSASYGGSAEQSSTRTKALTLQGIANYVKTFNEVHNFDIMLGYESYDWNYETHYGYGNDIYQDDNWAIGNTLKGDRTTSGSFTEYSTRAYISQFKYNYDSKYYVGASFRRDASSRFHPDNRWGNFYSVSAAWDAAKESFMENVEWVDQLKFKASFGQNGNDNLGNYYLYLDQYSITGEESWSDGTLAFKGNKDLTWEKSNSFNAGVDFSLWQGKLAGTVEYFNRQTDDMLYYKPVTGTLGYSSIPVNIGSIRNNGLEIEMNYQPVSTKNITWDLNFNATFLGNKILELSPELNGEMIDGSRIYKEGESMYQFYMVKYAGVDQTTGRALYWACETSQDSNGETIKGKEYATWDWNDAYNTNRVGTGDLLPTVYGGISSTFRAYGFDLSVQCAYQLGGKLYDNGYSSLMHGGTSSYYGQNWHADILDAWTPENYNTDVPRLNATDSYANRTSTRFLVSSDYFSINNITLGYTLPNKFTKKMGIESIRLYGSADNLALWSARKGLDPRQSFTTATTSIYTAMRTISGGVKFVF